MAEQVAELTAAEAMEPWLRARGYGTVLYDMCWMDCDIQGFLKSYRGREICLCLGHAQVLELGKVAGSYRYALTPEGCPSEEWPWRPSVPVALV